MRGPGQLKQEFVKKWVTGLQICGSSKRNMTILERKKAIKLSADVAMASSRDATAHWSRAVIANAWEKGDNRVLLERILGSAAPSAEYERQKKTTCCCAKKVRSMKILKRSCGGARRRAKKMAAASRVVKAGSLAKRLVKKRIQVLKRLVPGGECLGDDELSLIRETLDYILSLRVQVDVMRHLANATEHYYSNGI